MVYSREIEEIILTFAPSGWTYGKIASESTFVLVDKETESLWFPMSDGDCCSLVGISGFYADTYVKGTMNMNATFWSDWIVGYPDTKFVMD